jgi:hypothetical protein
VARTRGAGADLRRVLWTHYAHLVSLFASLPLPATTTTTSSSSSSSTTTTGAGAGAGVSAKAALFDLLLGESATVAPLLTPGDDVDGGGGGSGSQRMDGDAFVAMLRERKCVVPENAGAGRRESAADAGGVGAPVTPAQVRQILAKIASGSSLSLSPTPSPPIRTSSLTTSSTSTSSQSMSATSATALSRGFERHEMVEALITVAQLMLPTLSPDAALDKLCSRLVSQRW